MGIGRRIDLLGSLVAIDSPETGVAKHLLFEIAVTNNGDIMKAPNLFRDGTTLMKQVISGTICEKLKKAGTPMRQYILLTIVSTFLAVSSSRAQSTGQVIRLSNGIDEIVPSDARIEQVADGFGFIEGPIWIHEGYLLFSDIPRNVIMKWTPGNSASVFRKQSGYGGTVPPGALFGSNGLTLDKQGRLTIAEHGNRRITRLEKDGKLTILADRYEGKRLNSPNDLVYKSDGSLYFTDPPFGLPKTYDDPARELSFSGVYRVDHGRTQLLTKLLTAPNGLAFSPDEKYLFVANSGPVKKQWIRFEVKPDGTLGNNKVFYDVSGIKEEGVPDGMKVDSKGNLYCIGPGGIWIFSPQGEHLGTIRPPQLPANCNWGDKDGKTLYITGGTVLYRIRLKIAGIRP
jgi:gluconolactonase